MWLMSSFVRAILSEVEYPGYRFQVGGVDRAWLQAVFAERCAVTGALTEQFTRKWYISAQATRSEVVQTALKCVLTALEHEAREHFKYRGRPIFGPHFNVDALFEICDADLALDLRNEVAP